MSTELKMARRRANAIAWGYAAGHVLPPVPWKILMVLARRVNARRDDFEVWPDQTQIAEDANLSLSTVKRHLKTLEADGYFTRRQRKAPGRGFTGWVYILNVKAEFKLPTGHVVRADLDGSTLVEPTGQSDLRRQVNADPHRQVTADLSNTELGNGELGNKEPPMVPTGDEAPDRDLFGGELVVAEDLTGYVMRRWNELAERHANIASVKVLNKKRTNAIEKRGEEGAKIFGTKRNAWDRAFEVIEGSSYLCGEDPPGKGYSEPFAAWLDFVLRPLEFTRIIEGGYRATRTAETHDLVSGRRFGPAEQATRHALRGIFATGQESGDRAAGGGGPSVDGAGSDYRRPLRSAFDQYRDDDAGRS